MKSVVVEIRKDEREIEREKERMEKRHMNDYPI